MKRKLTLLFTLCSVSIIMISNSAGIFTTDYTGSASTPTTHCASAGCHDNGFAGDGSIDIQVLNGTVPITNYIPGATYTISITRPATSSMIGMQSGIFKFATSTGTGTIINNIMPTFLQLNTTGTATMISHTAIGTNAAISGGVVRWKYTWKAPPTDVGAIDVYATMNIANGNNDKTGDSIRRNIFTIQKPNSIANLNTLGTEVIIFPNPAENELHIKSAIEGKVDVFIYSFTGQTMFAAHDIVDLNLLNIQLNDWARSSYLCVVKQNSKQAVIGFIKN